MSIFTILDEPREVPLFGGKVIVCTPPKNALLELGAWLATDGGAASNAQIASRAAVAACYKDDEHADGTRDRWEHLFVARPFETADLREAVLTQCGWRMLWEANQKSTEELSKMLLDEQENGDDLLDPTDVEAGTGDTPS